LHYFAANGGAQGSRGSPNPRTRVFQSTSPPTGAHKPGIVVPFQGTKLVRPVSGGCPLASVAFHPRLPYAPPLAAGRAISIAHNTKPDAPLPLKNPYFSSTE